jgi:hypothetical protein
VRRGLAVAAGLGLALLVAGCSGPGAAAGAVPAAGGRDAFVREAQLRWPEAEFILGIGESDASAELAEARAVSDAAAAIRSRVARNFRSVEEGAFRGGVGRVESRVVDEVQQQVETDAGALIRPRHEHTRRVDGTWLAVAVAPRDALDARYTEEARPLLDRLDRAYGQVLGAGGWLAAAPAWCEVPPLEAELERKSLERWAVSRRTLWPPELLERSRAAHARRQQAQAGVRVAVVRPGRPGDPDPSDALVERLRGAGWSATAGADGPCPAGGLQLRTELAGSCQRTSLGAHACQVSLQVVGRACGDPATLFAVSRQAQATDSRDAERARRSAARKLDLGAVADAAAERALATLGDCRR